MNNLEEKKKGTFTKRFNISLAALSLAGVLAIGGASVHKNVDHLNSKCPFAFLYGDKVIEHHISEIKEENPDILTNATYVAPVGYLIDENGMSYKNTNVIVYKEKDGTITKYPMGSLQYAFSEVIKEDPTKLTETELVEQVRRLYR